MFSYKLQHFLLFYFGIFYGIFRMKNCFVIYLLYIFPFFRFAIGEKNNSISGCATTWFVVWFVEIVFHLLLLLLSLYECTWKSLPCLLKHIQHCISPPAPLYSSYMEDIVVVHTDKHLKYSVNCEQQTIIFPHAFFWIGISHLPLTRRKNCLFCIWNFLVSFFLYSMPFHFRLLVPHTFYHFDASIIMDFNCIYGTIFFFVSLLTWIYIFAILLDREFFLSAFFIALQYLTKEHFFSIFFAICFDKRFILVPMMHKESLNQYFSFQSFQWQNRQ